MKRGLGHPERYDVPVVRQIMNERLQEEYQVPLSQMEQALNIAKGSAPFEEFDSHTRKLMKWHQLTSVQYILYKKRYTEEEMSEHIDEWFSFMRSKNYWLGFFEWWENGDDFVPEQAPLVFNISERMMDPATDEEGEWVDVDETEAIQNEFLRCIESPSILEDDQIVPSISTKIESEELVDVDSVNYPNTTIQCDNDESPPDLCILPTPVSPLPDLSKFYIEPLGKEYIKYPEEENVFSDPPVCQDLIPYEPKDECLWTQEQEKDPQNYPISRICQLSSGPKMIRYYEILPHDSFYFSTVIWPEYLPPVDFADRKELLDYSRHILDPNINTSDPSLLTEEDSQPRVYTLISDIENSQERNEWHTIPDKDGKIQIIPTPGELPPQNRLKEEPEPGIHYRLSYMEQDTEDMEIQDVMAGVNWGNTFLTKWYRLDSKKMRALGKLIQETTLNSIDSLGKNLKTAHDNIQSTLNHKSDLVSLNTDRIIQMIDVQGKRIKALEISLSDISKDLTEAKTGPLKEIVEDLKHLKTLKENSIKRKRASMFPLPPEKPESLKPLADSRKPVFNIPIESQEQKPYIFGRKPTKEPIDPILILRDEYHPLPGTATVLPAIRNLSFEEFEQAELVELRSDEETSYRRHSGPHLFKIDHKLFQEQTYGPQHITDFGQLYAMV